MAKPKVEREVGTNPGLASYLKMQGIYPKPKTKKSKPKPETKKK